MEVENDTSYGFCQSQFWGFSRLSDKPLLGGSKILLEIRVILVVVVKSDYRVQQRILIDKFSDNYFENKKFGF